MSARPDLAAIGLGPGKKPRRHRILFQHGLRNGTALFSPYDHALEHGPRDFFSNPNSGDPRYIARLARGGNFNGVVARIGLAEISADISALDARIEAVIAPFAQTAARLDDIVGIGLTADSGLCDHRRDRVGHEPVPDPGPTVGRPAFSG